MYFVRPKILLAGILDLCPTKLYSDFYLKKIYIY